MLARLILYSVLVKCILSANILFINPVISRSHNIFNTALAIGLAQKGHNITMLSSDAAKKPIKNVHVIVMEGMYDSSGFDTMSVVECGPFESIKFMYDWGNAVSSDALRTNGLRILLDYPKDFKVDLIIFDVTISHALYPLIDRFGNPPLIGITAFLLPPVLANAMGNELKTSYIPHFNLQATNKMNFYTRFTNFLVTHAEIVYRNYVYLKEEEKLAKTVFGSNIKSYLEVERNMTLLLSNTDPLLDYPIALPLSIIPIGGMHIKSAKKLPKELDDLMNTSKHGVILFALGSNVQWKTISDEIKSFFTEAFSKLPHTVIWKSEVPIQNLPKNVIVKSWLPQTDILGHPNIKLFISHGGGLSTQEAIYYGVPVIGMPFFVDQHKNIYKFMKKGLGLKLNFRALSEKVIIETISEVLNNSSYSTNIKKLSAKYRDQPQTPLERAIFWTEYVIRHGGADDLNLPSRDMYFYESSNLDVIIVLATGLAIILAVIIKIIYCVVKLTKQGKVKMS